MSTKAELFSSGIALMKQFCVANLVPEPPVTCFETKEWEIGSCAYYRPSRGIVIHVPSCAHIGTSGQAWSYPGYFIDRTPHGVIQHELGHHVDWLKGEVKGAFFSDFSVKMRRDSSEEKLTNYCPNDAEWFAEMFRLYVTNSDLLKHVRPRTHALLSKHWRPVVEAPWREVLAAAPARNLAQCVKRGVAAAEVTPALL